MALDNYILIDFILQRTGDGETGSAKWGRLSANLTMVVYNIG
jgi:hypothetical protein